MSKLTEPVTSEDELGGWKIARIHPYTVEGDTITSHLDKPVDKWAIKFIDRDEQGRRRHRSALM